MGGVIDEDGTQWEHCNCCGGWVIIQELLYEEPSEKYPYGRDLCATCAETSSVNNVVEPNLYYVEFPKDA